LIAAIIQARLSSTRFPGKVFAGIEGEPLIFHVVDRLRWSKRIEKIVLATTVNPADDRLQGWADSNSVECFRGSEEDVLDRYYNAARGVEADVIVRITSDDPFKDPTIIDTVIELLLNEGLDFAYNNNPPTFPEGLDTEVFKFGALEAAQRESTDPFEREHVTQYFYRNPAKFIQANLPFEKNLSALRWTIDTQEDLEMAREVYRRLHRKGEIFLLDDILKVLEREPWIASINGSVPRSSMYSDLDKGV
jgi:spore coat polysaccharide biosynthesis protein SpsF